MMSWVRRGRPLPIQPREKTSGGHKLTPRPPARQCSCAPIVPSMLFNGGRMSTGVRVARYSSVEEVVARKFANLAMTWRWRRTDRSSSRDIDVPTRRGKGAN